MNLIFAGIIGTIGDVFSKYSATYSGLTATICMVITGLCWGSTAYLWQQVYKTKGIAEAVVLYSPLQMLCAVSIGILFFGEPLTWRIMVAYPLAGIIVWLLA